MDTFDSPLNLAHQQRRRGESLEESQQYSQSIQCHSKAADYLLAAQSVTTDKQALESLSLQYHHHINKQQLLRHKINQLTISTQPRKSCTEVLQTMITSKEVEKAQFGSDVMQTMEECDSLLRILDERAEERGLASGVDYFTTAGMARGCKYNKQADVVVEELRIHNDALRAHVMFLLTECEEKDTEIARLVEENKLLKQSRSEVRLNELDNEPEEPLPTPKDIKLDDVPNLPLAPLEKPHFDFTSFPLGNVPESTIKDSESS